MLIFLGQQIEVKGRGVKVVSTAEGKKKAGNRKQTNNLDIFLLNGINIAGDVRHPG